MDKRLRQGVRAVMDSGVVCRDTIRINQAKGSTQACTAQPLAALFMSCKPSLVSVSLSFSHHSHSLALSHTPSLSIMFLLSLFLSPFSLSRSLSHALPPTLKYLCLTFPRLPPSLFPVASSKPRCTPFLSVKDILI